MAANPESRPLVERNAAAALRSLEERRDAIAALRSDRLDLAAVEDAERFLRADVELIFGAHARETQFIQQALILEDFHRFAREAGSSALAGQHLSKTHANIERTLKLLAWLIQRVQIRVQRQGEHNNQNAIYHNSGQVAAMGQGANAIRNSLEFTATPAIQRSAMDRDVCIGLLQAAHDELKQYGGGDLDPKLKSSITKKLPAIRKIVADLGLGKVVTVVPPAMIGGPVMRFDPLVNPFGTGYGESHIDYALGAIEEAIGALEHGIYPSAMSSHNHAEHSEPAKDSKNRTAEGSMSALFISHASNDRAIVEGFVDLLESGIGVPHRQIFCSSLKGQNVKPGADFVASIREQLSGAKAVIALLSESFYASAFCMCELGGVWLACNNNMLPVIVPPLGFNSMKGILGNLQASRLGNGEDLDELRDRIVDMLGIEAHPTPRWNTKRQQFLDKLDTFVAASPYKGPIAPASHEKVLKELEDYKKAYTVKEQELEEARREVARLSKV